MITHDGWLYNNIFSLFCPHGNYFLGEFGNMVNLNYIGVLTHSILSMIADTLTVNR